MKKLWGTTDRLFQTQDLQIDLIRVDPMGHCSAHHHEFKDNLFIVLSGALRVVWGDVECLKSGGLPFSQTLTKNESLAVPSETVHQFWNVGEEDVVAIEVYTSSGSSVDPLDIVRYSQGGVCKDGSSLWKN